MKQSVLQLRGYYPSKIQFKTWPEDREDGGSCYVSCRVPFAIDRNDIRSWQLGVSVIFWSAGEKKEAGYSGEIELKGQFQVHPNYEGDLGKLVLMNGGSILYSSIRELLLSLSGRAPHGPFYLPSISMEENYELAKPHIKEVMNTINSPPETSA